MMLSQRGRINAQSTILDGYKRGKNSYQKDSNPNGVVSFSNAENVSYHIAFSKKIQLTFLLVSYASICLYFREQRCTLLLQIYFVINN